MKSLVLIVSFFLSFHGRVFASDTRIYYVTPVDEGGTCEVRGDVLEPCLPLMNYTSDMLISSESTHSNITMLFLPGEHFITSPSRLLLSNVDTFMMSPYSERGNAVVGVVCTDGGEVTMKFDRLRVLKMLSLKFSSCARENILLTLWQSSIEIIKCSFDNNNRALLYHTLDGFEKPESKAPSVNITASNFTCNHNARRRRSPLIAVNAISIKKKVVYTLRDCVFDGNTVYNNILSIYGVETLELNNCTFTNNSVNQLAYVKDSTNLMVRASQFCNNTGGGIHSTTLKPQNTVEITSCIFLNNQASLPGAFPVKLEHESNQGRTFLYNCLFENNYANQSSTLRINGYKCAKLSHCSFINNAFVQSNGGAVQMSFVSEAIFMVTGFFYNKAQLGGALYLSHCKHVEMNEVNLEHNAAIESGGSIYIIHSFIRSSNDTPTTIFIDDSTAEDSGGGIVLAEGSKLELSQGSNIYFSNNSVTAQDGKGGAIFVADDDGLVEGDTCPIYVRSYTDYIDNTGKYLHFDGNHAAEGSILYGGKLDICSLLPEEETNETLLGNQEILSLITSKQVSDSGDLSITSGAVDLCLCEKNIPDCRRREINNIFKYPGQTIVVVLVNLDQMYQQVSSTIKSYYNDSHISLRNNENSQPVSAQCQEVKFHVHSKTPLTGVKLVLENLNTYKKIFTRLTINLDIKPCPNGFELSEGKCICDKRLLGLLEECDIDHQTGKSKIDGWFEYDNEFLKMYNYHCPLSYCKSTTGFLNTQCIINRKGVLCGACADSYSIGLGSWRCLQCTHSHYNFIWLVPLIATAGVVLVVFLLLLKLTVSSGTINGLVFYTNVISVSGLENCSINPLLSVFISWVNLDFGIETCFYSGMDAYQKTWLQFAFPLYIWFLVGIIIIVCHYSSRAMKLMGKRCIDILATLFLLSYAKLLKTIITALSFVNIMIAKADNVSDLLVPHKVWTFDGNVDYLTGKHLPLFVVALFFLVFIFLPYTLLLTFGQCLRSLPRKRGLRWVQSTAFISIMDAYHAPFNKRHRYWTGLTLLTRCVLFTVFAAANPRNTPYITNVFTTTIITSLLLAIRLLFANTFFQNYYIDKLDLSFLLNLEFLAILSLYLEGVDADHDAYCKVSTASISVAFITFIGIVLYHLYLQTTCTRFFKEIIFKLKGYKLSPNQNPTTLDKPKDSKTTTSFIQLRESLLESVNY